MNTSEFVKMCCDRNKYTTLHDIRLAATQMGVELNEGWLKRSYEQYAASAPSPVDAAVAGVDALRTAISVFGKDGVSKLLEVIHG